MIGRQTLRAALAGAALLLLSAAGSPAAALEQGPYRLEVLVGGVPLAEYAARGTRYVEALEGREYSLRLTNRTARRIAVALSVDGLNTIDAKTTAARDAAKWILGPYESTTIEGWQTGPATARRFFFTTENDSYGEWLGKTTNLGIVAAAVFRERQPLPAPIQQRESRQRLDGPSEKAAPRAPSGGRASGEALAEDDLAATGIGRELDHRVRRVSFEAEAAPAAVMQLRYEYHDALVRLGVRPERCPHREDPLARRERARGFEDLDFAPDPFRGR